MPKKSKKKSFIVILFSQIALFLCHLFSLLPRKCLYLLADGLFYILFYAAKYRRKVAHENLKKTFPEKTNAEIKNIEEKFYRYLSDFFLEYIIILGKNYKKLEEMMEYSNLELLHDLFEKKKDIALVTAHYANWELISTLPPKMSYKLCPAYKRQSNPVFDGLMYDLRSKFGAIPVEMADTFRFALSTKRKDMRFALMLLADQLPRTTEYFTTFLNHEGTPIIEGPERMSRALDMAVVFMDISKVRRGKYKTKFVLLCENPADTEKNQISEAYIRYLEKKIQQQPEYWLWTHRRWRRTEKDYKKSPAGSKKF